MTLAEAARTGLFDKPFTFAGRAARSEFWWIFVMTGLMSTVIEAAWPSGPDASPALLWTCFALYALVSMICWSAWARRMHDRGWSAIWIAPANIIGILSALPWAEDALDGVIEAATGPEFGGGFFDPAAAPLMGPGIALGLLGAALLAVLVAVLFLVLMAWPGTAGPNRYGPDPRARAADAEIFA
ncbi:DUF805 domain-containing protein [Rhodovulum sp. DZ06]|uniref:DUF805 domain-containing protein n=1 Tax=Rhodovulum sp. DZ06 TaxID=3425126 RepID=UPI003D34EAEA